MDMVVSGFERDEGNREKCRKHGVTQAEIEAIFTSDLAVFPDPAHSRAERRFKAIGKTPTGRHVFVVFTFREHASGRRIRPIAARYMHQKEIDHYEKEAPGAEE